LIQKGKSRLLSLAGGFFGEIFMNTDEPTGNFEPNAEDILKNSCKL
jgi:hypothetical protein